MTRTIAALLGAISLTTPAMASDIYGGSAGSTKDAPTQTVSSNHSGLYITGGLGVADIDRDTRRDINRGTDLNLDVTGEKPEDVADFRSDLATVGIPSSLNGNNLSIPLVADHLGRGDSDELTSMVLSAGAFYLHQMNSRFGVSIGLDGVFYNNAETTSGHVDATGTFVGGTALADFNFGGTTCADVGTCAGQPANLFGTPLTQTGVLEFDHDLDIDLPIKVHFFLNDRVALNVGAGPSWARGSLKGANGPTDAITTAINGAVPGFSNGLTTRFDDEDWALGYVLTAGAQWWLTDRVVLGVQGDYKNHTFDFDASSSSTVPLGGPLSLTSHSRDRVEVEDDIFSIKATASIKLN